MSRRPPATTLLLTILLASVPLAGANGANGLCLKPGHLPDDPPNVAVDNCGPKIVVRILIPAAGVEHEMDVGPCTENCSQTITIEVIVCRDWTEWPSTVSEPRSPIEGQGYWPSLEALQEDVMREVEQMVRSIDSGPGAVQMETFLSCD